MAFSFKLEHPDGTPADPPTMRSAVPTWAPGDRIFLGPGKTLRVLELRTARNPEDDALLIVTPEAQGRGS